MLRHKMAHILHCIVFTLKLSSRFPVECFCPVSANKKAAIDPAHVKKQNNSEKGNSNRLFCLAHCIGDIEISGGAVCVSYSSPAAILDSLEAILENGSAGRIRG